MQTISWEVIHWKALARKIWFPTANIALANWIVEDGTYKINIILDGKIFLWAWAYREKEELFEAHLFNFDWDLYGKIIEVIILEKIRENKKINSLEELKAMIDDDVAYIKNNTFYGITFWTFDKFHPWHEYYLSEASKYCEKLVTVISTDLNVQKIKNHTPFNNQEDRKLNVHNSNVSDLVFIWEENNHLKYIEKYRPQVICMWYDQEGFIWELEQYIETSWLETEIIRIWDYKPEIYKSSKM